MKAAIMTLTIGCAMALTLTVAPVLSQVEAPRASQAPVVRIVAPEKDAIVSGPTKLEIALEPATALAGVESVAFTVDGRQACVVERAPFTCTWDPGDIVRAHHVRVVVNLADGGRLTDNVRTKDLGFTERIRTDAVLVPVIVTDDGEFVRGLKAPDFEITEDGVKQPIASVASEDAPLDLVLAIDVSGSMERSLDGVKSAVKHLLSKLRHGDAATLVGFNDTMFLATEREKSQAARERAVDLLSAWGGTALYDATVRSVDLVSKEWGRKGIVIFSDGDDHNSLTSRDAATARVQASDAMLYTVGFGSGATVTGLRNNLESYARATGGRAFFPQRAQELDGAFDQIVAELANQYVLSYAPSNMQQDNRWRAIKVRVKNGKYDVRARQGYRAASPPRSGR
jgi:VWFA-related protein